MPTLPNKQPKPRGQIFGKEAFKEQIDKLQESLNINKKKSKEGMDRFTEQEILLFWYLYRMELLRFKTDGRVTREMFKNRFNDLGNDFLKDIVLEVIDRDRNGIDFVEFLSLLRVLTRGTQEETHQLAFAIFDWHRDGTVQPHEMEKIVDGLSWEIKTKILVESNRWKVKSRKKKDENQSSDEENDEFAPQSPKNFARHKQEFMRMSSDNHQKESNILLAPGETLHAERVSEREVVATDPKGTVTMTEIDEKDRRPDDFFVAGKYFRMREEPPASSPKIQRTVISKEPASSMFTYSGKAEEDYYATSGSRLHPYSIASFDLPPTKPLDGSDSDSETDTDISLTEEDEERLKGRSRSSTLDQQINALAGDKGKRKENQTPIISVSDEEDDDDEDEMDPQELQQIRAEKEKILHQIVREAFVGHEGGMDYNAFKVKANQFPKNPVFTGFGILNYFRDTFFGPLEKKVQQDTLTPPIQEGVLLKRNPGFFGPRDIRGKHRRVWVSIRSGFCFIFKRRPKDGKVIPPSRAIPLTDSKVMIRDEFTHHRVHFPHRLRKGGNKGKKHKRNAHFPELHTKYSGQDFVDNEERKYGQNLDDARRNKGQQKVVVEGENDDDTIFSFGNRVKKRQESEKKNPLFQESATDRRVKKKEIKQHQQLAREQGKPTTPSELPPTEGEKGAENETSHKKDGDHSKEEEVGRGSNDSIVESDLVAGLARSKQTFGEDRGEGLVAGTWCFYLSAAKGRYRRYFLAKEEKERLKWMYAIVANSPEVPNNRYNSFVAPKDHVAARWFVDGTHYMGFLASALEHAKKEIFIAGWWVCPDLYLRRGKDAGDEYQLKNILKRKADEGVVVSVIAWNESTPMALNSAYTKKCLEALSPNIRVMRHPHTIPVYWTHHQKIVVIDQDIAFLGGIDVCYGRWDDSSHLVAEDPNQGFSLWPGKDFFNESLKAVEKAEKGDEDIMDRKTEPRQPWHDIHMVVDGAAARDVSKLFVQRWNHHIVDLSSDSPHLFPKTVPAHHRLDEKGIKTGTPQTLLSKMISQVVGASKGKDGIMASNPIQSLLNFVGCTVQNPVEGQEASAEKYDNDSKESKDSKEETASQSSGKDGLPNFPHHHAIEPVGNLKPAGEGESDHPDYPNNPPDNDNVGENRMAKTPNVPRSEGKQKGAIPDLEDGKPPVEWLDWTQGEPTLLPNSFAANCEIQIVRSMSRWSGALFTETSIHEAYLSLIENAEKFIYIENQYFISPLDNNNHNKIGWALYKRIVRAAKKGEKFRVVVVMPAFPTGGSWKNTMAVQYVMKWEYETINRGGHSIMERLKKRFPRIKVEDYISFHALRSASNDLDELVSEQVYVHAKLMIVDDRIAICGSANINDRSMKGDRDSEICAVIKDHEKINGTMDGKPFEVRKFAHELRKRLWREHCGLEEGDNSIRDPLAEDCYKGVWLATAKKNTEIFDKVFDAIPKDSIKSLKEVKEEMEGGKKPKRGIFGRIKHRKDGEELNNDNSTSGARAFKEEQDKGLKDADLTQKQNEKQLEGISFGSAPKEDHPDDTRKKSIDLLKEVKGHLVYYPLLFLEDESLTPGFTNPEAWVSVAVFQ
eukprot:TRINITY_DN2958_c0_g3_i2.p1 TRINITY_DN2958_c0_g3~~TRINITY_DN2958_c0_g3_i2.p1  ORF type:complete len:1587 (-),score=640.24 TRINITY_DN2958_c0_g3_i2:186-4946(-)